MEFGPRALGNRSILADPRSPTMRQHLNDIIKQREEFRPFAPAVVAEEAATYFDIAERWLPTFRHMLVTAPVRTEYRARFPLSRMSTARRGSRSSSVSRHRSSPTGAARWPELSI
jgi:carbamoyltransferase